MWKRKREKRLAKERVAHMTSMRNLEPITWEMLRTLGITEVVAAIKRGVPVSDTLLVNAKMWRCLGPCCVWVWMSTLPDI
jgi:hypothetical protein